MGYPSSHKGYRCLDLSTRRIIIQRRVVFDEFSFPFAWDAPGPQSSLDFLLNDASDVVHCPTNHAAGSTCLSSVPTAAAPSSMDVEQLLPATSPGMSGLVPLPGPAPPSSAAATPAPARAVTAASASAPVVAAAPASAAAVVTAPAAPPGYFDRAYMRRCNGPLPVRRFPTPTQVGVLQPPVRAFSASHIEADHSSSDWYH